jgi:hypothetical protein
MPWNRYYHFVLTFRLAVPHPTNHGNGAVPSLSHVNYNTTAGSNNPHNSDLAVAPQSRGSSAPLFSRQTYDADLVAMLYPKSSNTRDLDKIMAGMTSAGVVADDATVIPSAEDVNRDRTLREAKPMTKKITTADNAKNKLTTRSKVPDRTNNTKSMSNYEDHSASSQDRLQVFVKNHKGPINWHSKRSTQTLPKPTSANPFIESDTELSDAPSDITDSHVAVRKIDYPVPGNQIENLEPRMRDAADMDAAKLLAGFHNFR